MGDVCVCERERERERETERDRDRQTDRQRDHCSSKNRCRHIEYTSTNQPNKKPGRWEIHF